MAALTFRCMLLCSILLLLVPGALYAQQAGEVMEWNNLSGGVNWTQARVLAEGIGVAPEQYSGQARGRVMACRAAVVDAQRNLLETTKGVRVEGETRVEEYVLASDKVRTTVSGVVRGAMLTARKAEPDGSCAVTMEIPLSGTLASEIYIQTDAARQSLLKPGYRLLHRMAALLLPVAHGVEPSPTVLWRKEIDALVARLERLERQFQIQAQYPARTVASGDPTGLVLDARGSNFIPSMSPNIRRLEGGILYPTARNQSARHIGELVSLFMDDLILAQGHPRVGERPLVLKALRTYGDTRTEIVVSDEAANRLAALIEKGFLDNAEVIIVLD